MVGILVHGNNHLVLSGPAPTETAGLALARNWAVIQIGEAKPSKFGRCKIRRKEFRENLDARSWCRATAIFSPGPAELPAELAASEGVLAAAGDFGVARLANTTCSPKNKKGRGVITRP
jgi:hypothetical protein